MASVVALGTTMRPGPRAAPAVPAALPQPVGFVRTNWSQDPFALGSYSYLPVGATPRDRQRLARPVAGTLYFAGEAINTAYPSTVTGAYLSGRSAAARIIRHVPTDAAVDVVVIGAGMAGLIAARDLQAGGHRAVVIEARDRVGGRIATDSSLGVPLDLGAAWIHGVADNPVKTLADDVGVVTIPTDYGDGVWYDRSGRRVRSQTAASVDELSYEVIVRARQWGERRDEDTSLRAGIDVAIRDLDPRPRQRALLANRLVTNIEHEYAADLSELSLWHYDAGRTERGGDEMIRGGFGQLPAAVAESLDVRTGQVVERIDYSRDQVTVRTDRATFSGARAVITLPIGVLQAEAVTFAPELPARLRRAISAIGMGVLDKLYLGFDEPFWDDVFLIDMATRPRRGFPEWFDLTGVVDAPVLAGFTASTGARTRATWSDSRLVADAMGVLGNVYT